MKKGDKVFCKKEHYRGMQRMYQVGKSYSIINIVENYILVIENDKKGVCRFVPKSNTIEISLYDFFYTEKECRKLKIKKINERSTN